MWENIFKKEKKEKDIKAFLKENLLFQDLTKRELKFVEDLVHRRQYKPGELVFKQDEIGIGMYIVTKGSIDITVNNPSSPNDEPMFVTRLESNDFFGEIALIEDEGRRSANAIASDNATVLGFFKPDLQEIIERNPTTGAKIMTRLAEVLGKRLVETSFKVSQLKKELENLSHG